MSGRTESCNRRVQNILTPNSFLQLQKTLQVFHAQSVWLQYMTIFVLLQLLYVLHAGRKEPTFNNQHVYGMGKYLIKSYEFFIVHKKLIFIIHKKLFFIIHEFLLYLRFISFYFIVVLFSSSSLCLPFDLTHFGNFSPNANVSNLPSLRQLVSKSSLVSKLTANMFHPAELKMVLLLTTESQSSRRGCHCWKLRD